MKLKDWLWVGIAGTGLYLLFRKRSFLPDTAAAKKALTAAWYEGSTWYEIPFRMEKWHQEWQRLVAQSDQAKVAWSNLSADIRDMRMNPVSYWAHFFSALIEQGWMLSSGSLEGPKTCQTRKLISAAEPCANGAAFLKKRILENLQQSIYRDNNRGAQWSSPNVVFFQLLAKSGSQR